MEIKFDFYSYNIEAIDLDGMLSAVFQRAARAVTTCVLRRRRAPATVATFTTRPPSIPPWYVQHSSSPHLYTDVY